MVNRRELTLKGSKAYYKSAERILSLGDETAATVFQSYEAAFDGLEPRYLVQSKDRNTFAGVIDRGERFSERNHTEVFPALLNIRGLNGQLNLDSPSKLRPLLTPEEVHGVPCYVLEASYPTYFRRYYVNPQAAYRIERFEGLHTNRQLIYEIEFSYTEAPPSGGAIGGWTTTLFSGREITERCRVVVQRHEVGIVVDDDIFRLKFPPGTQVDDRRKGRQFMVRADGSERVILPRESRLRPTREELMRTAPGGIPTRRASASFLKKFLINIAVSCLAILVVFVLVKRFRRT